MKKILFYTGRRFMNGKIVHRMQDQDGKGFFFKVMKHAFIGQAYLAQEDEAGITEMKTSFPERAEGVADHADSGEWEVTDQLARDDADRAKMARQVADNPPAFDAAVKAIAPLLRLARTRAQRRQLVEMLLARAEGLAFRE